MCGHPHTEKLMHAYLNRRYTKNSVETFYVVTNSFMLSLDNDPQMLVNVTLLLKRFWKKDLKKQLW